MMGQDDEGEVCVSPGVKNADESELRAIASPPEDEHMYNVADFNVMADIVDGLTRNICDRVEALDRALKGEQGASWELLWVLPALG